MKAALVAAAALGLLVSGCASMGGAFRAEGIPAREYYVGGGFQIDYTAPAKGTAYLVEESTGKLLVTESLQPGEQFTFDVDPSQRENMQRFESMGINPAEAKISLYFIPEGGLVPGQIETGS